MKAINLHLSLRALGYLVALAETRHFGRAAELCFVSQPTLSAQLKKMEEQLGVQLVERGQSVRLTEVGARVVERARRIIDEAREIEELARNVQDPLAGELRVGLIPTVGPYLLPHIAAPLRARFPRLKLLLLEHQTRRLLELLKDGELDVAILALPLPGERVTTRALYSERFQVALPEHHPLAKRKRLGLEDLDGETLLLLEDGHCLRDQALEACSLARVREAPDFRATSLETLRQMVAAGIGITLLPNLAAEPYGIGTPGLTLRRLKDPEPARTIAAAWRPGCAREETITHLCSAIEALMRDIRQL
ncbi:LysR substrate-binding domain-containing protein [Thioalkalivibrio sp. XN8]|uniref:LysR substrate-binding domain-containing protein n=1 Tax=Thioalkalivibrio sp. XN8 TaxID=2712863 RepID=UPI0013EE0369|nr:LysR substrate-binding domain-containing protein [Thioalkalivibrio sp. XN8]NGP52412.1 LysR family transcriptional regulator [Thioalkalivibrio sp. XN8]